MVGLLHTSIALHTCHSKICLNRKSIPKDDLVTNHLIFSTKIDLVIFQLVIHPWWKWAFIAKKYHIYFITRCVLSNVDFSFFLFFSRVTHHWPIPFKHRRIGVIHIRACDKNEFQMLKQKCSSNYNQLGQIYPLILCFISNDPYFEIMCLCFHCVALNLSNWPILTHLWYMTAQNSVNTGSGNGLLPDGTKAIIITNVDNRTKSCKTHIPQETMSFFVLFASLWPSVVTTWRFVSNRLQLVMFLSQPLKRRLHRYDATGTIT